MAKTTNNLHDNQNGLVSIIVTMTISIILALITAGFIRIMSREYRQSLDQQLSTQALYAAESGINDARKGIAEAIDRGDINDLIQNSPDQDCSNDSDHQITIGGIEPDNNLFAQGIFLSYSCLLVDNGVEAIQVDNAGENRGRLYPIQTLGADNTPLKLNSLTFRWQNNPHKANPPNTFRAKDDKSLPIVSNWQGSAVTPIKTPMLRVTIYYPGESLACLSNGSGCLERDLLQSKSKTFFLNPEVGGAGIADYSSSTLDGSIVSADCQPVSVTREYACTTTINAPIEGFNSGANNLFVRVRPVYDLSPPTTISINATVNIVGAEPRQPLLLNAQYRLDVTGRANDVYRRLSVRIPYSRTEFAIPEFEIDTNTICKQLEFGLTLEKDACGIAITTSSAPPPSGGSGSAEFRSGCIKDCVKPGPKRPLDSSYYRGQTFTNTSKNPRAIVAGCTWDWGDGSSAVKDKACYEDDTISHTFPTRLPDPPCEVYAVLLTIKFNNGYPDQKYGPQAIRVPWGRPC